MSLPQLLQQTASNIQNDPFVANIAAFLSKMTLPGKSSDVAVTTVMMALFFGTNALLFALFQLARVIPKPSEDGPKKNKEKELSKPFVGTVECFTNLTTEFFRCGLVMGLTYVCEKHWMFPHSGKTYSRDLFLFVLIIFFGYGFYTIKPIHDLTLLGREQTEEWKGWMQFIFLLYHYFHAEEVYNAVRVMITCYVWMTGFGNFSFFYVKQDFSWLRVAQMMWRLNFSVLLLMWTHGNTYILYYICPMHTFYFLMVYVTMYLYSTVNHSKWGIRFKLMALGVIIYIVWDINNGLFDLLFAFLGTTPTVGAGRGSVWEYYFRTSLDHWSSFLGMIFALNFPLAEQYYNKARGWPLVFAALAMGAVTIWWLTDFYMQDKLAYNLTHAYFAIIPLTSYIFFRNLTPAIRSGVSMSFHDLGKTTLETYLLQHHIWLTSNAKTLLTITPGHPWINFALATVLFFVVSKELYRITMSLRGMVMPDDKNITWKNCIGLAGVLAVSYIAALILHTFSATILELGLACLGLSLLVLLLISRYARATADNYTYQLWSNRFITAASAALVVGILVQLVLSGMTPTQSAADVALAKFTASFKGNTPDCLSNISQGNWTVVECKEGGSSSTTTPGATTATAINKVAYCRTDKWQWKTNPSCPIGNLSPTKAKAVFKGKNVAFLGDSIVRNVYYQFITMMEPTYSNNGTSAMKHSNLRYSPPSAANTTVWFYWAPFVTNITSTVVKEGLATKMDLIVSGSAAWDALYQGANVQAYQKDLDDLGNTLMSKTINDNSQSSSTSTTASTKASSTNDTNLRPRRLQNSNTIRSAHYVWLQPTTVVDAHLVTAEKQKYMAEDIMMSYRKAFLTTKAALLVRTTVDTTAASSGRETVDGIHYNEDVYKVIAQMTANAYMVHFPVLFTPSAAAATAAKKKVLGPKPTGSMSFPSYGALVLALAAIMLFSMDSFLGVGYLSLQIFGRSFDWESAYGPLHKKVLGHNSPATTTRNGGATSSSNLANSNPSEKESLLGSENGGNGNNEGLISGAHNTHGEKKTDSQNA